MNHVEDDVEKIMRAGKRIAEKCVTLEREIEKQNENSTNH